MTGSSDGVGYRGRGSFRVVRIWGGGLSSTGVWGVRSRAGDYNIIACKCNGLNLVLNRILAKR